ncbi:MAG: CPBP family intramembrane metalloprotease [Chitinophagaceae bacterium]|nr:CPBP family intramembrane metalloprotease [Chitinophagaceae bacterium]
MKGSLKTKSGLNQFLLFVCVAIVSFVILSFIGGLVVYQIYGKAMGMKGIQDLVNINYDHPNAPDFIRGLQIVQFISLFLIPSFFCAYLFSEQIKKYLGLKPPPQALYWITGIAIMLLSLPLANFLGVLNQQLPLPKALADWMKATEAQASKATFALLSHHTVKDLVLNLIFVAGLAAVGEELVFRGMIQRLLMKAFKSPWAGIIVSAILFSAIHMQFLGFLPRFLLGILLGAIYWYSGSLYAAMLAHFIYDAFVITVAYFMPETLKESDKPFDGNMLVFAAGAVVSLAIITYLLQWMKKHSVQRFESEFADDSVPVKDHPF